MTIGWVEGRLQGHTTNLTTSKSKMDQWLGHLQLRLLRLILEYARGSEASCIRPESGPGPGQKVEALISFLDLEQSSIVLSFKEHELRLLHGSIAFGSDTSQALALCRALGITNTDATLPTPTHINLGGKELLFYQSASPSSKIVTLVVSEELREDGEGVVAISEEGSSKLLFLSTCQPERIQLHTCQT